MIPDRLTEARAVAGRLAEARGWAGLRQVHIAKSTGTMVAVLDGREAGLDTDGGRWSTLCDDHGHCVAHPTLALARAHAACPEGWCEPCMEALLDPDLVSRLTEGLL